MREGESGRRALAPRHDVIKRTDLWQAVVVRAAHFGVEQNGNWALAVQLRCIRISSSTIKHGCRSGLVESKHASATLSVCRCLNNHLTRPRPRLLIVALELALHVSLINRLLDRACSLVSQLLVLEHCIFVSTAPHPVLARHLQNVSSSSVRLYVSG
jgi:hypothetical protein